MALYHFSVRHVSRGKGQMVVASAAYISGQRIYDGYYNMQILLERYAYSEISGTSILI